MVSKFESLLSFEKYHFIDKKFEIRREQRIIIQNLMIQRTNNIIVTSNINVKLWNLI